MECSRITRTGSVVQFRQTQRLGIYEHVSDYHRGRTVRTDWAEAENENEDEVEGYRYLAQ